MRRTLPAVLFVASVALPAYGQNTTAPAETAVVTGQTDEIQVPEDAPKGSSSPTAVGVGVGVGAIVVVFGIAALGAAFAMGGS